MKDMAQVKKTNLLTFSFFCIIIIAVTVLSIISSSGESESNKHSTAPSFSDVNSSSDTGSAALPESSSDSTPQDEPENEPENEPESNSDVSDTSSSVSMADALFIGDSRTVGIMEYAGIEGADFFCNVGMSVYNVFNERISVPGVGKVTLEELLSNKEYGKVYIMLGLNEIGYNLNSIVNKYGELLEYVESTQPDAKIFIQANLHVAKKRSDTSDYENNPAINRLNKELIKFSDGIKIYYIDVNPIFDDESGSLAADKTSDNVHLYAKYYAIWGKWICEETARCVAEGKN